jgi:hypothetical protein
MSSLQRDLEARRAAEPVTPSCYSGGTRSNRAFIEFRPDPHKRIGFPWAQLCHYTLEPDRADAAEAAERLTLAFSTADVVLVGARLGKLVDLVNEHDLDWVAVLDARYSNLVAKSPWIASITIARLDKSGSAAG